MLAPSSNQTDFRGAAQRQHEGHGRYGGGYETGSTHNYMAASTTRLGSALAGAQVFGREGGFVRDKSLSSASTDVRRYSGGSFQGREDTGSSSSDGSPGASPRYYGVGDVRGFNPPAARSRYTYGDARPTDASDRRRSTSGHGPASRSRRGASRDQEALSAPQAASWGLAHLQFLERMGLTSGTAVSSDGGLGLRTNTYHCGPPRVCSPRETPNIAAHEFRVLQDQRCGTASPPRTRRPLPQTTPSFPQTGANLAPEPQHGQTVGPPLGYSEPRTERLYCRDCGCEWDYCCCRPDSGSVDYQQADQGASEGRCGDCGHWAEYCVCRHNYYHDATEYFNTPHSRDTTVDRCNRCKRGLNNCRCAKSSASSAEPRRYSHSSQRQYRFCNGCDWEESLCKCHQPHASSWQPWRAYHEKSSSFADSDEGYVEEGQQESRLDSSGMDVACASARYHVWDCQCLRHDDLTAADRQWMDQMAKQTAREARQRRKQATAQASSSRKARSHSHRQDRQSSSSNTSQQDMGRRVQASQPKPPQHHRTDTSRAYHHATQPHQPTFTTANRVNDRNTTRPQHVQRTTHRQRHVQPTGPSMWHDVLHFFGLKASVQEYRRPAGVRSITAHPFTTDPRLDVMRRHQRTVGTSVTSSLGRDPPMSEDLSSPHSSISSNASLRSLYDDRDSHSPSADGAAASADTKQEESLAAGRQAQLTDALKMQRTVGGTAMAAAAALPLPSTPLSSPRASPSPHAPVTPECTAPAIMLQAAIAASPIAPSTPALAAAPVITNSSAPLAALPSAPATVVPTVASPPGPAPVPLPSSPHAVPSPIPASPREPPAPMPPSPVATASPTGGCQVASSPLPLTPRPASAGPARATSGGSLSPLTPPEPVDGDGCASEPFVGIDCNTGMSTIESSDAIERVSRPFEPVVEKGGGGKPAVEDQVLRVYSQTMSFEGQCRVLDITAHGMMQKRNTHGLWRRWQARYFYIQDGELCYVRDERAFVKYVQQTCALLDDQPEIDEPPRCAIAESVMHIPDTKHDMIEDESEAGEEGIDRLIIEHKGRRMQLQIASAADMCKWRKALRNVITEESRS